MCDSKSEKKIFLFERTSPVLPTLVASVKKCHPLRKSPARLNRNISESSENHLVPPFTAWKVSQYGFFSGPYFPVFGLNIGKYRPEKTPYLDTFHAVFLIMHSIKFPEIFPLYGNRFMSLFKFLKYNLCKQITTRIVLKNKSQPELL